MPRRELKNKPLVEAILEVRWALQPKGSGTAEDPHYKILLGRLFDRFQEDYPEHEQLATASIPDEMVGHVVQHRFRTARNDWPLVQVGPGILAVNETDKYTWDAFRPRTIDAVGKLFEAYPKRTELVIENLSLRYIDAIAFDYTSENAFEFLREKLKIEIGLPQKLFEQPVGERPKSFSWQASFPCREPVGAVHIRSASGHKDGQSAVMLETTVQSSGDDLPNLPNEFDSWIDSAHEITSKWFFTLIEGDLERRFDGD